MKLYTLLVWATGIGTAQISLPPLETSTETRILREKLRLENERLRQEIKQRSKQTAAEDEELSRLKLENTRLKAELVSGRTAEVPQPRLGPRVEGSGPSFEQSGFSLYTVTGASRAIDSGTKTVGTYGAGFQYAVTPGLAFFMGAAYAPITGATLDWFGLSRQDVPSFRASSYSLNLGIRFTVLSKSRIQPYVSTGPGVLLQRYHLERLPTETYGAATLGGAAGLRVYVLPNVGFYAGLGVAKVFVDSAGLSAGLSVGAFYDFRGSR